MKVFWARSALADLSHIHFHIRENNPPAADFVIETIRKGCASLESLPQRGRISIVSGCREMVFQSLPYIALYRIQKDSIEIMHIFHSAQDWP